MSSVERGQVVEEGGKAVEPERTYREVRPSAIGIRCGRADTPTEQLRQGEGRGEGRIEERKRERLECEKGAMEEREEAKRREEEEEGQLSDCLTGYWSKAAPQSAFQVHSHLTPGGGGANGTTVSEGSAGHGNGYTRTRCVGCPFLATLRGRCQDHSLQLLPCYSATLLLSYSNRIDISVFTLENYQGTLYTRSFVRPVCSSDQQFSPFRTRTRCEYIPSRHAGHAVLQVCGRPREYSSSVYGSPGWTTRETDTIVRHRSSLTNSEASNNRSPSLLLFSSLLVPPHANA
jgi:hypothetical protein